MARPPLPGASPWCAPQPAQDGLDLGERLLDGREVGGVRRQEEQLAVTRCDRVANTVSFVGAQIVHDDHLSWPQRRRQLLGDVPSKRCPYPSPPRSATARAAHWGRARPPTWCSCRGCAGPIHWLFGGAAPSHTNGLGRCSCRFRRQRRTALGRAGSRLPRCTPGAARLLIALAGCQCLFLCVHPKRRMARHIVASLS